MFGSKKNKLEEQRNEAFAQIIEQRQEFETSVALVETSEKRIQEDANQVMENTNHLAEYAMRNIEAESELLFTLDDFSKSLRMAGEEHNQLVEAQNQQVEAVAALVEENKHYTSPAKYLTEFPAELKPVLEGYESKLQDMANSGKEMTVMALNAAIEAGRMGESGKQFVLAAEEIRKEAIGYERAALTMKEELNSAYAKIDELQEVITRLVGLMKDNNMGTTKVLKKVMETNKLLENSTMRDFSEDIIDMRDKVIGLRNMDEEIAKCAERNQIQLVDIQEEIQNQKTELLELESNLSHVLDKAEEQIK